MIGLGFDRTIITHKTVAQTKPHFRKLPCPIMSCFNPCLLPRLGIHGRLRDDFSHIGLFRLLGLHGEVDGFGLPSSCTLRTLALPMSWKPTDAACAVCNPICKGSTSRSEAPEDDGLPFLDPLAMFLPLMGQNPRDRALSRTRARAS